MAKFICRLCDNDNPCILSVPDGADLPEFCPYYTEKIASWNSEQ